ncbi:hypothetical protein [Prosthecobacter sp.]
MHDSLRRILLHPKALAAVLSVFIFLSLALFGRRVLNDSESESVKGSIAQNKDAQVAVKTMVWHVQAEGETLESKTDPDHPAPGSELPRAQILAAKEAKLTEIVLLYREYAKLWQDVVKQAPGLENFYDTLRQWHQYRPEKNYAAQAKQRSDLSKSNPELGKALFKIMYLQRPAVLLGMLNDPSSQFYMKDVLEIAGAVELMPREIKLLDIYASIYKEGGSYTAPRTLEEYRAFLESRTEAYSQATQQLARANGIAQ